MVSEAANPFQNVTSEVAMNQIAILKSVSLILPVASFTFAPALRALRQISALRFPTSAFPTPSARTFSPTSPQTLCKLSKTHRIPAGPVRVATPRTEPPLHYVTNVYNLVGTGKPAAARF